jgi:hypothetical protein
MFKNCNEQVEGLVQLSHLAVPPITTTMIICKAHLDLMTDALMIVARIEEKRTTEIEK